MIDMTGVSFDASLGTSSAKERCKLCSALTIPRLVQMAEVELAEVGFVPDRPDAHYQHHDSIEALEASANSGCDLCTLFVNTLKGYEENDDWTVSSDTWVGSGCDPDKSLFGAVQRSAGLVPSSDIKICLASGHSSEKEMLDGRVLMDTILVQVGPTQKVERDPELEGAFEAPDFPQLYFKLTVPRGA